MKWTKAKDDAYDKKHGIKKGSKKDIAEDKKHGVKDRKKRKPKLGSGGRFKALSKKVGSPALAAWIGRKKYGAKKFASLGAKGKKRSSKTQIGKTAGLGLGSPRINPMKAKVMAKFGSPIPQTPMMRTPLAKAMKRLARKQ